MPLFLNVIDIVVVFQIVFTPFTRIYFKLYLFQKYLIFFKVKLDIDIRNDAIFAQVCNLINCSAQVGNLYLLF